MFNGTHNFALFVDRNRPGMIIICINCFQFHFSHVVFGSFFLGKLLVFFFWEILKKIRKNLLVSCLFVGWCHLEMVQQRISLFKKWNKLDFLYSGIKLWTFQFFSLKKALALWKNSIDWLNSLGFRAQIVIRK